MGEVHTVTYAVYF